MPVEDCANAVDDDGDGLTDLNDPDCSCKGIKDTLFVPSSLIPNPSFEDYNCCPTGLAQLNCSKNWIQASTATSDYFHTCGFWQDPLRGSPPLPLPAGNGYVGFLDLRDHPAYNSTYKEYIGACLTNAMVTGREYTLSFWIGFGRPGNAFGPRFSTTLGIFGTSNCANLPFGGANGWLCPTAYPNWIELTRVTASGNNRWVKVTVKLRPTRPIAALVIGPQCTRADGQYYFFLDELLLEETTKFDSLILAVKGNPCSDTLRLTSPASIVNRITYQWYRDGVAIPGAVSPDYVIPKGREGNYVLRASDSLDCELSNAFHYDLDTANTFLKQSICRGDSFLLGSKWLSASGRYVAGFQSASGCDSLVHLDLTVFDPEVRQIDTVVCRNKPLVLGGKTYDSSGVFQLHAVTREGCDSLTVLNLTVVDVLQTHTHVPLCEGKYIVVSGDTLRTAGIYFFHYQSIRGCDSISNITIENHLNTSSILDTSICQGGQLNVAGRTFDQAGSYTLDLKSTAGCDSLLTVNLLVHPVYGSSLDTAICEGQFLQIGNQVFDKTGGYGIRLSTIAGCDSNLRLNLNVWPSHQRENLATICEGDSLYFSGRFYNTSGRYENTYLNQFGCDSLEILDLHVNPVHATRLDTAFCDGQNMRIGNENYFMEGDYHQRLQNRFSCDSILNIHLSRNPVYHLVIDTTMCHGGQWRIGNQLLNQSGTYRFSLKSAEGCDSTVTVNMEILPAQLGRLDTSICFADSLVIAGNHFLNPGQYQLNLPGRFGCDSVLELHIRKSEIPDIQVDKMDLRCYGDQSGSISLKVTGNASPYRIVWQDGPVANLREKLSAGRYAFTVWDDNQCSRELGVDINAPDPLVMNYLKLDANCLNPQSGMFQLLQSQGGVKPYSYFLNSIRLSQAGQMEKLDIGNHVLEMVDSNGCRISKSFNVLPPVRGETALDPDSVFIIAGDTVWLEVQIRRINAIRSVKWSGPGIFGCDTCLNTAVFLKQTNGVFMVIITDDQGCLYEESIVISSKRQFNIPNVFSPNGDGINDLFNMVTDRSVAVIDLMQIYDRWGNQVYESRNFLPGDSAGAWNGEIGGRKALPGVYVYLFVFRDQLGQGYKRSGDLTLIR